MLCQAYETYVALFTGGFKPRATISCLSMCWRRAACDLSPGKDAALQNGPLGSVSLRRNSKYVQLKKTSGGAFQTSAPRRAKALSGHGVSWLSLSSPTCLQIIFLISRSFVCPILAQINLGSLYPSHTSAVVRSHVHRNILVCAICTQEVIILFIWNLLE